MSVFINRTLVGFKLGFSPKRYTCIRGITSTTNEESKPDIVDVSPTADEKEAEIEKIRNKSRLRPHDRNLLFDQRPYSEPLMKFHLTVKYNRKLYGKYGKVSGVNPGIMWPTKNDISERKEYERVAYPHTINEMVSAAKMEIEEKENEKLENEKQIIAKMAKLEMWKQQLRDKIAKKEAEALAAKEKKEKLLEEVRRHFGFTVDPKDERFKEMVALKEKEMKKKEKQARMEEKEKKAIARLMEKHKADTENES